MRALFTVSSLKRFWLCLLPALAVAPSMAGAQMRPLPAMNPYTVSSPSGEYTLRVDPSNRYAMGEATYRLQRKGKTVWEGERPFTLYEAGVTNDGTTGGYAYTTGLEGLSPTGPLFSAKTGGDLDVVILNSSGQTRLLQKTPRKIYSGPDFHSAYPEAQGLIFDADHDRMIVRVIDQEGGEKRRCYRLSTGQTTNPLPVGQWRTMQIRREPAAPPLPSKVTFDAPLISLPLRDRIELRPIEGESQNAPPSNPSLPINEVAVRADGSILQSDLLKGVVHLYDAQGHWQADRPSAMLAKEARAHLYMQVPQIKLGLDNRFFIQSEEFDKEANSLGIDRDTLSPRARAEAIKRRPDGTWVEFSDVFAIAPDGSLALQEYGQISLYTAQNKPERLIALPSDAWMAERPAYDGKLLVLLNSKRLYAHGRDGKPRWQCLLPAGKNALIWTPFLTESGHTLCLFDGRHTLYRYALP